MPAPVYAARTEGAVALSSATPKTILGWKALASSGLLLVGYNISFDGVSATAVPVLVEICYVTWATNPPGTNSSSVTPTQELGRVLAVGATAAKNWGTEPTVVTPMREILLTPNGGTIIYDYPLGTEPESAFDHGFAIRCNAPAGVNVRATLKVSRC